MPLSSFCISLYLSVYKLSKIMMFFSDLNFFTDKMESLILLENIQVKKKNGDTNGNICFAISKDVVCKKRSYLCKFLLVKCIKSTT